MILMNLKEIDRLETTHPLLGESVNLVHLEP